MMRGVASVHGKAPQGADPRRSAGSRGEVVASLHSRAAAAGQIREPARHRLRPRGDQPARGAGGGGRHAASASRRWKPSWASSAARRTSGSRWLRVEEAASEKLSAQKARLETLEANWIIEKELVEKILGIRSRLRGINAPVEGTGSALEESASEVVAAEATAALDGNDRADALERAEGVAGATCRAARRESADPGLGGPAGGRFGGVATGPASRSVAWSGAKSRP